MYVMAIPFLFTLFATCLIMSACIVVFSKNTVYSALALIVAFFNAAILMLLSGAEFISFVVMIVYVGAVAVLFLFVVMMLNIKAKDLKITFGPYLYITLGVALLLAIEIGLMAFFFQGSPNAENLLAFPRPRRTENIVALGQVIYTHYAYIFQIAGLILFVAMIGAIVLTDNMRRTLFLKKQDISTQTKRSKENSLVLTSPPIGKGVSLETSAALYHSNAGEDVL
jgi:NADH-quinone oxidoreductase subunit J